MNELARWVGRFRSAAPCEGVCPTGVNVQFTEELTFRLGDEWLHYDEHARGLDGRTLHAETGVIRETRNNQSTPYDISLMMNSGRLEFGSAAIEGDSLRTHSTTFHNDRLDVIANAREFRLTARGIDKHLWLVNTVWPDLTHHMWDPRGDATVLRYPELLPLRLLRRRRQSSAHR